MLQDGSVQQGQMRPITITFNTITDRNEVHLRRANIKQTADFHDAWLNEDLGQNSRRVNTIVTLVAKEAQKQGIPCKPAKFSIRIKDKKFDEKNFAALPESLTLHDIKTVTIGDFIAYKSERSKFSNFYPCKFRVGKHIYNSVEQAYHYIRARAHQKW